MNLVKTGGVGQSVRRKEDARFLTGTGEFVADIKKFGLREVAFLRSPVAHGRLVNIAKPEDGGDRVFTAADLDGVAPIKADSALPGFKSSVQPVLATGKVRYVGEVVAACIAPTRAEAEDLAETVRLEIEDLPVITDMLQAREDGASLVHEAWGDNVFLETFVESDVDMEALKSQAAASVTRTFRTARQSMAPIEGRGAVAEWDKRLGMLTLTTATQMPHIVRSGLAECLGLAEGQIRVIAPDVGGGFGYKGILLPEEVVLSWIAMTTNEPVCWIEDRREQLAANANCREHHYEITAHADADGKLLAVECEATVDAGAYSVYPFSACLEAAQVASILPGPYDFPGFRCRTWSSATNKPPILPYRGVARTGVCFALETLLDPLARQLGLEPHEFRRRNLAGPERMPFENVTKKHFDSGDYPQCLARAAAAIDVEAVRTRQGRGETDGRRIGVGFSIFCEQAAHGTSVYAGWGIPMVPGFEQATVRMTPDGGLEVRVGVHSHGQSLETTLAQVANEILGIPVDAVKVVHGDTAYTPYSTGTWGSRCAVMAGGAVATSCETLANRLKGIGAHLLQCDVSDAKVADGKVIGPNGSVPIADIAYSWYRLPQDLPDDVAPEGLEVTQGYKPERDSGTFSYAAHACIVAIDTEIGEVEILDYVIIEDGGVLINPMVVDGQVYGGTAQGLGTALYEEMVYDENGQPLSTTLGDYLLPSAVEMPPIRIDHMETPSPYTRFGQKGLGEGGAIGPPAAIANAINDALKDLGVTVDRLPMAPARLFELIRAAGGK
ncbi:MAG: xanthine dehydrogenase family protein [Rhodospirillaceae bacterium]|jgi:carbon-monoxide dehydrogenase large subunit|nr:xanthine dehydrogenase family protein [Rhodospirillaceae bacterium]